jgi:hypothetical protein
MKNLIMFLVFTACSTAFTAECVNEKGEDILNQPEVFQALIEKAESCYEAEALAEACAWGSSLDVSTAGLAYGVCESELNAQKPKKELVNTLNKMKSLCTKKYSNQDGTLYRSMNAFCHLRALSWTVNIATPN